MPQKEFVRSSTSDGIGVITLLGDVTPFSEKAVLETYESLTLSKHDKILLDFSSASYINSGGIAIIISMVTEARKRKQVIGVCSLTPHFQKIFDMIGLTDYIRLFPTQEKAFEHLR